MMARRCWSLAAKAALSQIGAVKDGLERLCRAAHRRLARRRARSWLRAGGGRARCPPPWLRARRVDVLFSWVPTRSRSPRRFVVYQGTHGDRGAHRADVILPGAAYTEKSGTYVNTEGRVQMGQPRRFPPGEAREDWAICGHCRTCLARLPFDTLQQLRKALYASPSAFRRDRPAVANAGSGGMPYARWPSGAARSATLPLRIAGDSDYFWRPIRSRAPLP
jgi:NADH-quinone oxidoreductase subunit G